MKERILSFLAYLLIKVVCLSISYRKLNHKVREQCRNEKQSYIYAFWHGRQFLLLGWNTEKRLVVMTSLSQDGRLQAKILSRLGFHTVAGSSSRGAVRGLLGMIRTIKTRHNACVAVDGPRGPVYKVKPGIIYLASKTNSVIIPLTARAKYRYVFKRAWDKFEFPIPFSPAVVIMGAPIKVPSDADEKVIEEKRLELENSLQMITKMADNYFERDKKRHLTKTG